MRSALVLGAGGFIGSHLVRRLRREGYYVHGVDLKHPEHWETAADKFTIGDLRSQQLAASVTSDRPYDEVYQLAADMGGAGYLFVGVHDAEIMHNSMQINLNVLHNLSKGQRVFYASSACVYPEYNQLDPDNPNCAEGTTYPAEPESEYGWEKLFSERMYLAHARCKGIDVRIGRFHNIFGPYGTWQGGKEKAPAAICRKVAQADNEVTIWGDGLQTRSFLYIDEAVEAVRRLMSSSYGNPLNIGSDERISINGLVKLVADVAGKAINVKHVEGPIGVRGRCSDNALIQATLGWRPSAPLRAGIEVTYEWIKNRLDA